MLKMLNVIQIYLLLCSAVMQGAFKFRSCAHHCGHLIVALRGNDGFQYADSECVKEVRCFLSDLFMSSVGIIRTVRKECCGSLLNCL
jgi:hypothetical protein